MYLQGQKTLEFTDDTSLKITGSARYDKSEFFDGFVSPRLSLGLTLDENHNIRGSIQTGFRNPTTQDLFIGLNAGRATLVGSSPDNLDRYVRNYDVSVNGQALGNAAQITQSGRAAYENSYLADDRGNLQFNADGTPVIANPGLVQPERIVTAEIGYRGKIDKITVDFSTYFNSYSDFISTQIVAAPLYGSVADGSAIAALLNGDVIPYSAYTNSDVDVNSYGASLGITWKLYKDYQLSGSYTYSKLDFDRAANPGFNTNFNTPEHKFKASFGNDNVIENLGFNIAYRFSDDYFWEASFGNGLIPEFHVLDAQVNLYGT